MGRAIKFRAWDERHKEFHHDTSTHRNEEGDVSPWVYEQFTGLLDSKGVEIYEGDIIDFDGDVYVAEISWNQENCRYEALERRGKRLYVHVFDDHVSVASVVVGNVHQTPSLLEENRK